MGIFRRSFSISEKLRVVAHAKENGTLATALHFKIHPSLVSKWTAKEGSLSGVGNKKLRKVRGKTPMHPEAEGTLINSILQQRIDGIPLTIKVIIEEMKEIVDQQQPGNSFKGSYSWANAFMKRHGLSLRTPTATISANKWSTELYRNHILPVHNEKIKSFQSQYEMLMGENNYEDQYIINADETPTWLNSPIRMTIDYTGAPHVPVKCLVESRKRITTLLTVTKAGRLLPPVIVQPSQSKKAKTAAGDTRYMKGGITIYKQKNNTMNGHIMVDWVKNYLSPMFPREKKKLLILDSASCHKTDEVKKVLHEHNFDILMIPGGCTKYLQPLDISVNRSFKAKLKDKYVESLREVEYGRRGGKKISAAAINMGILVDNIRKVAREVSAECIQNGFDRMLREY